jgi:hypothetical protein
VLERDVMLRGRVTNQTITTSEVFVSSATCGLLDDTPVLQIPLHVQPTNVHLSYPSGSVGGQPSFSLLPVRLAWPAYLETAAAADR